MLKLTFKTLLKTAAILSILIAVVVIFPRVITELVARPRIFSIEEVPTERVAIVFGAGLRRDGQPTPVLIDRVTAAAQLYFRGKVEKLLMSGDNRFANYNEPKAMQAYAMRLGVPKDAIVLDYAGRSTYDTCYRAKAIFEVSSAVLITQRFHLPRALYTCRILGIKAEGVPADLRSYRRLTETFWNLRELGATLNAFIELHITRPLPVLGNAEPIFPPYSQ